MAARFEKFGASPLDGFDARNLYQMVPMGGRRDLVAITDGRGCMLQVQNPSIARLANLRGAPGLPRIDSTVAEVSLPPNVKATFSVMGIAEGRTELVVRRQDGGAESNLIVSVKKERLVHTSLCFLSDRVRETKRNRQDAVQQINRARTFFQSQANVRLNFFEPNDAALPATNLGLPLDVGDDERVVFPILRATHRWCSR